MKFMKLGSKPDAFQADGNSIRFMSSELATDITIRVGEVKFYLHKFPLLSKSNRLQKLVSKAGEDNLDEIHLADFPGGPKAFEICAKFSYGMTVTLNPYNVVAACCAAEYLEMTEDIDRGNLIFKIEVFLTSSVLRSWKDSIIALQTTRPLLPWSEDLNVVGRCIDSIASKTSVDPSSINWSYTCNRKLEITDKFPQKINSIPKDWWVEDLCELEIDLYKQVISAIKSKGRMNGNVIGEALKTYTLRWLQDSQVHEGKNKYLVETIISLLPSDKDVSCSCSFLLKLLKIAILVGADDSLRENLISGISLKLDEASFEDLLIPAQFPQTTICDIELVQCLVNRFVMNEKCSQDLDIVEKNEKNVPLLNVGKLIDMYLAEVAHDQNLSLSIFIDLSQSIPKSARPVHDGLYGAIDIYLKEHPSLTKSEKKKVCGLMDVKKLSPDASMHAAQNERLPLRLIVQVLFFEQVRASAQVQALNSATQNVLHSTANAEEDWETKTVPESSKSLRKQLNQIEIKDEKLLPENEKLVRKGSKNRVSGLQLLPSRSRRIFDKLWVVGKGHAENKSSETSGSSQSPSSMAQGEVRSSGSSSRHRRHSIS